MMIVITVPMPGLGSVYALPAFQRKYPLFRGATASTPLFIGYELAYAAYFVAWEFFYRGFLLFGLGNVIGRWAVFVQMLPFAILHFGKPEIEAFSSVFGGLVLGWLAWRTRSFWYGVAIHASMAVYLDLLVGIPRLGPPPH
jgi:CAAX protease family protein